MESIPQRPEGNTAEASFMKWVWDCCARRLRIRSVPNQYDVSYDDLKGVMLGIKIRPGGAKSSPVQSDYAGVYVPGQSYDALEWVVVQSGTAAGAYISTADGNSNAPITGINWVQCSALPQWF